MKLLTAFGACVAIGFGALAALMLVVLAAAGLLQGDEPATLITRTGVRLECPGIIGETAVGYTCGELVIPVEVRASVLHFGPRSRWW